MSVVVESSDGLRQEITIRGKSVIADEPLEDGGTDQGPSPYELLLSALGSCTSMTILLYARRKQWPVEHVRVVLDHSRVHVRDCEECEEHDVRLDYFRKRVTVRIGSCVDPAGYVEGTARARRSALLADLRAHIQALLVRERAHHGPTLLRKTLTNLF